MGRCQHCLHCGLSDSPDGWLLTPIGYYCPLCAEKLPVAALAMGEWQGSPEDIGRARERALRDREADAKRVRFRRLIGGYDTMILPSFTIPPDTIGGHAVKGRRGFHWPWQK